jgi:hypothetical protein
LILIGLLLLCWRADAATVATPPGNPTELFNAARDAVGNAAWNKIKSVHITGTVNADGANVEREAWLDPAGGRFTQVVADGPMVGLSGYDGSTAWDAELDGIAHPEPSAAPDRIIEAWWQTFGWIRPPRPGSVTWLRADKLAGRHVDVVGLNLAGKSVEIWFDEKSHLPSRIVLPEDSPMRSVRLSEWRHVNDITLPFHAELTMADGHKIVETVTNAELNGPSDAAHFVPPTEPAIDYVFPGAAASVESPMVVQNGKLFIAARIAKTPLAMMLDLAGTTALDHGIADKLGLPVRNSGTTEVVRPPDFRLAGIKFRHFGLPVASFAEQQAVEGVPVDGRIGFDLLRRFVVEFDFQGRRIVFVKPESFVPPPEATSLPLVPGERLAVAGRVDGIPVALTLATDRSAALTLSRSFIDQHQLDKKWPIASAIVGWHDDKEQLGWIARAASLELGVYGQAQPLAEVIPALDCDAMIGVDTLSRFDMIVDFHNRKVWVQPLSNLANNSHFDHSGMWLNQTPNGLVIAGILPGSPAERAMLAAGDIVNTVSGERAKTLGLPAVRDRLRGPPGSAIGLVVSHGSETRNVRLVLADPLSQQRQSP